MPLGALIASIPSPSFNQIGPFRLYGLCIALGVIAAVTISSRRWEARGGNPDDIGTIAIWAVPAGVIGARLYHVATDWKRYRGDWAGALDITQGGLGIPGGIFLGVVVGLLVVRAKGLPKLELLDVVAPALPVAQAIGRLGNYFNQEVYGRPTSLPWGLEIDPEVSADAAAYPPGTTFHPTFLYEGLWNVALAIGLVWLDRRRTLRPGELFAVYVIGYGVGRLWVEALRADEASLVLGVRINIWMSLLLIAGGLAVLIRNRLRSGPAGATTSADGVVSDAGSAPGAGVADGGTSADRREAGEGAPVADRPSGADERVEVEGVAPSSDEGGSDGPSGGVDGGGGSDSGGSDSGGSADGGGSSD